MKKRFSGFVLALLFAGAAHAQEPERLRVSIVDAFPHDAQAYTQGLFFKDGALFESTGLVGRSTLRRIALESGAIEQSVALPSEVFGEGSAVLGERIVALTWRSGTGFVFDALTLRTISTFTYAGEGWGLAADGDLLVMSDGTAQLRVLDPQNFAEKRRIGVTLRGAPLANLNELEFVDGRLYANVWQTDFIVRIDLASGAVDGIVDASELREALGDDAHGAEALNGIAYDAQEKRLFVTGKLWPKLFEVRFTPVR